jgi:hypothetical protein
MVAFQVALLAGRTLALVLGGLYLAASQTVLTFSVVGVIVNVAAIVFVGHAVKNRERAICPHVPAVAS